MHKYTQCCRQGQFGLGPQCEGGPTQFWKLFQIRSGSVLLISTFLLWACAADACTLYLTWLLCRHWLGPHSLVSRSFFVKSSLGTRLRALNCQVCMYCRHAQKGASWASRTDFRAFKFSKFPGDVPPDPPQIIYSMGPTFCICPGPPQSSWWPRIYVCLYNWSQWY